MKKIWGQNQNIEDLGLIERAGTTAMVRYVPRTSPRYIM